jgi:hypothetical protein
MKDSVKSLTARDSIFAAAVVEMSLRHLAHNWVVAVRAYWIFRKTVPKCLHPTLTGRMAAAFRKHTQAVARCNDGVDHQQKLFGS